MELIFRTRRLQRCFEEEKEAIRSWGTDVGRRYVERVNFILAANVWDDLFTFQFLDLHPLRGNRQGQFAARLTGKYRLIVRPGDYGHDILIIDVEDYHG